MSDEDLVIGSSRKHYERVEVVKTTRKMYERVEVCRSFAFKLNCANHGGAPYESMDFFVSEKAECNVEDELEVSAALFQFCRGEVLKAVVDAKHKLKSRSEDIRRIG